MNQACSIISCPSLPDFICTCSEPWLKLCKIHLQIHLTSLNHAKHILYPAFKMTTEDQKPMLLEFLKNLIQSTINTKNQLQQMIESFLSKSSSLLNLINRQIHELKSNLKILLTENRIMKVPDIQPDFEDFLICYEDIHSLKNNFKDIKKYVEIRKEIQSEVKEIIKNIRMNEVLKEYGLIGSTLYFFNSNSKIINIYNTSAERLDKIGIPFLPHMSSLASIMRINKDEIFVTGGKTNPITSSAFIINPLRKSFKQLKSGSNKFGASPSLLENKIYIFGGVNKDKDKEISLDSSSYFSLVSETWTNIQKIPTKIGYTSTLTIDKEILISGDSKNLYLYSAAKDTYREISNNLNIKKFNILIPFKQNILIVSETVYISSIQGLDTWKDVAKLSVWKETTCKPMIRGKFCYFAGFESEIYKFDCVNYVIKTIANY